MEKNDKHIEFQINFPVIDNNPKFDGFVNIKNKTFNSVDAQISNTIGQFLVLFEYTSIGPMVYYSEKI